MNDDFLPDPLSPDASKIETPPFLMAERSGHIKTIKEERTEDSVQAQTTIEEERRRELEDYRQRELSETKEEPFKFVTEEKEETLEEVVQYDVAVSEAEAGKIKHPKLPTTLPVKTIRIDLDKFNSFFSKKFYKVKLDYDLYFEVNANNREDCVEKVLKFVKSQLKGMLNATEEDMEIEEFIPNLRMGETDTDYVLD